MTSRRELISQGIGLMAAIAVPRSLVAQPVVGQAKFVASPLDPMQLVNPQFRVPLQSMPDLPPTEWTTAMLAPFREGAKGLARPLLPAPAVVKRMIPGPKGAPEVPLYITGATAGASKRRCCISTVADLWQDPRPIVGGTFKSWLRITIV